MKFIKRILATIEIVAFLVAVVFGYLWVRNPAGNYDPVVTFSGIIGGGFELIRRFVLKDRPSEDLSKDSDPSIAWLKSSAHTMDLSLLLPRLIQIAKTRKNRGLEKWARLELKGYYPDNGMEKADVVPTYRAVAGQHEDEYGRPLIISDEKLGFINEMRLRNGIKELEELSKERKTVFMRDPQLIKSIRENLNVDVTRFAFNTISIHGILEAIRMEVIDRLDQMKDG